MMGVLRAGAAGYVRKDAEPEILLAAVRAVARGRTYIDRSAGEKISRAATHDLLTARDRGAATRGARTVEQGDRQRLSGSARKP